MEIDEKLKEILVLEDEIREMIKELDKLYFKVLDRWAVDCLRYEVQEKKAFEIYKTAVLAVIDSIRKTKNVLEGCIDKLEELKG